MLLLGVTDQWLKHLPIHWCLFNLYFQLRPLSLHLSLSQFIDSTSYLVFLNGCYTRYWNLIKPKLVSLPFDLNNQNKHTHTHTHTHTQIKPKTVFLTFINASTIGQWPSSLYDPMNQTWRLSVPQPMDFKTSWFYFCVNSKINLLWYYINTSFLGNCIFVVLSPFFSLPWPFNPFSMVPSKWPF